MFEFVLGLLFAGVAFFALKRARMCRRGGYGGGSMRGRRARHMVAWLSRRLEATEAQESVIREALDEVFMALAGARGSMRDGLEDLAAAFREDDWDVERLGRTSAEQEAAVEKLRNTVIAAFGRVHEALEPWQRRELARFLEQSRGRRYAHGG